MRVRAEWAKVGKPAIEKCKPTSQTIMIPLLFWKRKHKTGGQSTIGAGTFGAGQLTFAQLAILEEIASPWVEASLRLRDAPRTHDNVEAAFRRAFRGITEVQLAEYVFVTSRPAAESRAVLTRGRGEFTKAALAALKTMIPSQPISHLVADDGALLVSAIVKQTDSSAPTKPR